MTRREEPTAGLGFSAPWCVRLQDALGPVDVRGAANVLGIAEPSISGWREPAGPGCGAGGEASIGRRDLGGGVMDEAVFSVGFRNEADLPGRTEDEMRMEADRRLRALSKGHTDITGAGVSVEELTGDVTPHVYEVTIVLYIRPENIAAVEKRETPVGALKGALSAVERQVREERDRRREPWKPL